MGFHRYLSHQFSITFDLYLNIQRAVAARQRELCQAHIQGVPLEGVNVVPAPSVPSSNAADLDPDAIVPDEDEVSYPYVLANLIATEFACVTIHSDTHRNLLTADYNMKIPPSTFDEAMQHLDHNDWLNAMHKEINLMSEMGVYKLTELPEGRKAIECRWVLEFKEDGKGGPMHKACLVAQGFSQVPGIDFSKTFAPVARASSI